MRRLLLVLAVLGVSLVPLAHAVTNGEPDDGAHPYVGLVGFYDAGDTYVQRCSGTLISTTVFLTAAHCTVSDTGAQLRRARVWFEDVVPPGALSTKVGGVGGTVFAHPGFAGLASLPDTNDIAVVVLDGPVTTQGVATLPAIDLLAGAGTKGTALTLVGYGNVSKSETGDRTRRRATAKLADLTGKQTAGINLKTKPGKDGGTFCFGDSGGPVLLGETNVVVALNSLVKQSCKGAALSFRVDTAAAQAFLAPFLGAG